MCPLHRSCLLESTVDIGAKNAPLTALVAIQGEGIGDTYRLFTDRSATADQLASSAQPLALGYEGHAIAFLVDREVTAITEYYRIGILAVAIVAYGAFRVLLFAMSGRFTVYRGGTAGAGSVGLRGFGVWFRYS